MRKKIELVNADLLSTLNTVMSILIIALLFFIFGFTTWINAILIPYFKVSCELNNVQSLFPDLRKAEAIKKTVAGLISEVIPASIMREHEAVWLYLDKDSASMLS